MGKAKKDAAEKHGVGFFEMIRDVLVTSINKGQFPIALVGGIFLLMVWKMPGPDVSKLAFDIVQNLKDGYLIGHAFGIVMMCGWFFHAKAQRRGMASEIKRLAAQRSRLQEREIGNKLPSSDEAKVK